MISLQKKVFKESWVEIDENLKFLVLPPTTKQEMKLQNISINDRLSEGERTLEFMRYYLKCVIKGWEGIEEDCRIINNELAEDQWEELVIDVPAMKNIFGVLYESLKVTKDDKKKF